MFATARMSFAPHWNRLRLRHGPETTALRVRQIWSHVIKYESRHLLPSCKQTAVPSRCHSDSCRYKRQASSPGQIARHKIDSFVMTILIF